MSKYSVPNCDDCLPAGLSEHFQVAIKNTLHDLNDSRLTKTQLEKYAFLPLNLEHFSKTTTPKPSFRLH